MSENLRLQLKKARNKHEWTQAQLAEKADVCVDSVRRTESGRYSLPPTPRKDGQALGRIAKALDLDSCSLVRRCFSEEEISNSVYSYCLSVSESSTLQDYVGSQPATRKELMAETGRLHARAMCDLVNIENLFSAYELLVSRWPPFFLFADDEYILKGSVSAWQTTKADRRTYEQVMLKHRDDMRSRVLNRTKRYDIVLEKQGLTDFLAVRESDRAKRIVQDMKVFLRRNEFNLVILDSGTSQLEEFEILSSNYPIDFEENTVISLQHRHVGLEKSIVYELVVIGSQREVVRQDHERARALWDEAVKQTEQVPDGVLKDYTDGRRFKRVTAYLLDTVLTDVFAVGPQLKTLGDTVG